MIDPWIAIPAALAMVVYVADVLLTHRLRHSKIDVELQRLQAEAGAAALDASRARIEVTNAKAETRKAQQELEEMQAWWVNGVQAKVMPTSREVEAARRYYGLDTHNLHIAVVGVSGSGKSSLVNSIRGLSSSSKSSAPVGCVETTKHFGKYVDTRLGIVYYDIPSTQEYPDWHFFSKQGLCVFDAIIVCVFNRFSFIDLQVIRHSKKLRIPTFLVRSRSDIHIRNFIEEMEDDAKVDPLDTLSKAQTHYVKSTKESLANGLTRAGLEQQDVYIVSKAGVRDVVETGRCDEAIDEIQFLNRLMFTAVEKRTRLIRLGYMP